jgi:transcription-repair coupling factor (superfamily II helicase)
MGEDPQLWSPLLRAPFFRELERRVASAERGTALTGLVEGSRSLVLSLLMARTGRQLLLVLPDDAAVGAYQRDLSAFASLLGRDPQRIAALAELNAHPYDAIAPHQEIVRERVMALDRLRQRQIDVLLAPVRALLQPLPPPELLRAWTRSVGRGDTLAPERFVLESLHLGYRRVEIVNAPGEISRRGGILDVFPPTAPEPVRIELFGDTVDSLRSFDTDNQRSTGQLDHVVIGPAMENPPTDEAVRRLTAQLESGRRTAVADPKLARQYRELLDQLANQGYLPGFEALAGLTVDRPALLFEHAAELLLVVDEPELVDHELARAVDDLDTAYRQAARKILPAPSELFADPRVIRDRLAEASLLLQELSGDESGRARVSLNVPCRTSRTYSGRIHDAIDDLRRAGQNGSRSICVMRAPGSADRLLEIFSEYDLEAARITDRPARAASEWTDAGGVIVALGRLRSGFEFPEYGLSVLTERDLFGEERKRVDRKIKGRTAFISDFRDLKQGDVVVHTDHGVARFAGLGRPKGGSLNRDFMVLEFAGRDRLFVPVDRLDLVQKYSGVAGKRPALDRLGGPGWDRVKARVRKSVESMARELLELYARRRAARGHAFSPDTTWQKDLEAAFPFELTPDQRRAMQEIKNDMESVKPTDRLLVGDVGYGKTEVAVRAAFKTVMDGFQVAVLAPTTVLALQHYETFRQRFAPFPTRVEMVSRFRSAGEIKNVLEELAIGTVDVLIGTHRLLSKDVCFRRLGLLVVDEEQRFGVAHKERLKQLSIGVDVISLTATPIPRTLQMSLAGVRDLSIIETPPPGRTAIQTYITPFRKNVLTQALRHELRRKGQVFFVHNKIDSLPALTRLISEMVPEARVVMAHGKMRERQLESVMLRFVKYDADVLVTTTIIENGLDIPRANTIIVNRADHFGLAQLYQLRGRVGRSDQHAYAYFVVPSRQSLTEEARKRLLALQEFSELGAGFRLAAADLEIRGAGELLGSRQHGHIAALGFDLYCQMLERSVQELRGEPVAETPPVSLHLGVDIKIPQSFLPDAADRLVIYKRLAQARSADDIDRLQAETEDRYGHLPMAARNLFDMGRLRLLAENTGVKSVNLAEDRLQIRFHDRPPVETARILEITVQERGSLHPSGMVTLPAPPQGSDRIPRVATVLRRLREETAA